MFIVFPRPEKGVWAQVCDFRSCLSTVIPVQWDGCVFQHISKHGVCLGQIERCSGGRLNIGQTFDFHTIILTVFGDARSCVHVRSDCVEMCIDECEQQSFATTKGAGYRKSSCSLDLHLTVSAGYVLVAAALWMLRKRRSKRFRWELERERIYGSTNSVMALSKPD